MQADPETLRRARQIAARLAVPRPRRDTSARRGVGELASVRYNGGSDDIDLDRTVDQLVEHPVPEEDDIIVRERVRTRRSVVLLVDVSGSMRGERIRTAAATVGALAAELDRDDLSVVAFWSDAAVLSHLGQHVPAQQLLEEMLLIPARGHGADRSTEPTARGRPARGQPARGQPAPGQRARGQPAPRAHTGACSHRCGSVR